MRKPKFRVYFEPIIEDGEVIYEGFMANVLKMDMSDMSIVTSDYCSNPNENVFMFLTGRDMSWKMKWKRQYHIMQHTGLRDVDSENIYEGDIVEVNYPNYTQRFVVIFSSGMFKAKSIDRGIDGDGFSLCTITGERRCKIVGNIYENPELLEVE